MDRAPPCEGDDIGSIPILTTINITPDWWNAIHTALRKQRRKSSELKSRAGHHIDFLVDWNVIGAARYNTASQCILGRDGMLQTLNLDDVGSLPTGCTMPD